MINMNRFPTLRRMALVGAAMSVAACGDVLNVEPVTSLPQDQLITDNATATAALNGAYDGLQSGSYYGLSALLVGDLASDNTVWTGTFQYLGEMATNRMQADNAEVTSMWTAIYQQIDRDNVLINKVPQVTLVTDPVRSDVMGQAYFMRALGFHNLVKFWGGVPIPTKPIAAPSEAQAYTRATVTEVYTQILKDLDSAQVLIRNTTNTRYATPMAARALRARVLFYRAGLTGNAGSAADYQGALDAANLVLAGRDTLTVPYADLFGAAGSNTTEDIFRVSFNATETNGISNYYLQVGRAEVAPSPNIDAAYPAGDARKAWSIRPSGNAGRPLNGNKYAARPGTEHVHVIRLAEVILIKAEALARLNRLPEAVAAYNKVRVRAGIPVHTLGNQVTTQTDVINAIELERRLELAFEGDRWPDLNRLGKAIAVKGIADRPGQALFPIPLRDTRTSPGLVQNAGY
ncbi:MAG TPA: RagB/SusD family nutrient uptake outer membrane protein [Gemmatimonas aurantiaca]|uniref:RagB/SusD family nutrient uptake outer membrane protein n=3 Tax=Gemmatimonas aurantiaca TaxID=173480 RepID=A0A3D4VBK2_9BACT|nr:putative outer membrane protein [Gemmatimonas aurantiaca T-27]HCT57998.1 RagB/SusD family nutrient uptake outer membrane protein [Gemmatimonas aurantiaca]